MTENNIIVGDLLISLVAAGAENAFAVDPLYRPEFIASGNGDVADRDRIRITVRYGTPLMPPDARELFDTEGAWKLLKSDARSRYYVALTSPGLDPPLYKVLVIDEDLRQGTVFIDCDRPLPDDEAIPLQRYPLRYPLDEMLVANLLARDRGVAMHGLGIVYGECGILFSGKSGAGKSTLGALWRKRGDGGQILNTDRLIVRPRETCHDKALIQDPGGFRLFGTPWHGDGERVYGGAPLAGIFILHQADENRLIEIDPAQTASALLVRSFPTFWDARGLQWTVDLLARLSTEVPCYELNFRPEQAAIDLALASLPGIEAGCGP